MLINLANIITCFRFCTAILLLYAYFFSYPLLVGVWLFACMSDYLDGFVARYLQQESVFGALLDPIADKVTVLAAFIIILHAFFSIHLFIVCSLISSRDIYITALRLHRYFLHGDLGGVQVTTLAKLKTAALMLSITCLLYCIEYYNTIVYSVGFVLLYSSALVSIYTLISYSSSRTDPVHI